MPAAAQEHLPIEASLDGMVVRVKHALLPLDFANSTSARYVGEIENQSGRKVGQCHVLLDLLERDGSVIGHAQGSWFFGLDPGQRVAFTAQPIGGGYSPKPSMDEDARAPSVARVRVAKVVTVP